MPTNNIILLFIYWFLVWGVFNLYLVPLHISILKGGNKSAIYFLIASIAPLTLVIINANIYFLILVAIQLLVTFITTKQLQTERNLLSDIIFQQSMLYLLFALLGRPESIPHFFFFILAVSVSHLPIVLLKHVKLTGKLLILLAVPLAATIIYFAFRNLYSSLSMLISLTIHFGFYLVLMQTPYMRKSGIII